MFGFLFSGDGLALEACLRFKKIQEEKSTDAGSARSSLLLFMFETGAYVKYDGVMAHFKQDTLKAESFMAKRRTEPKGTSTCRNSGEERKRSTSSFLV